MTPFNAPGKQAFWKHCEKRRNLLVTSNFSFSHSVFYPFGYFLLFSSNLKLSTANSFSLEESKIFCLVMGYLFITQQNLDSKLNADTDNQVNVV